MQTALAGASVSMNPARSGAGEHMRYMPISDVDVYRFYLL